MKKLFFAAVCLLSFTLMTSCGGSEKKTDEGSSAKTEQKDDSKSEKKDDSKSEKKADSKSKKNSPSAAVLQIFEYMKAGDMEALIDQLPVPAEFAEQFEKEKAGIIEEMKVSYNEEVTPKGGYAACKILKEEISEDGTTATVTATTVYGDGTEETEDIEMVLVNGEWKMGF